MILTAQSAQVRLDGVGEPVCPSHRDTTSQNKQSLTRLGYTAVLSKIELLPRKLPFEDPFSVGFCGSDADVKGEWADRSAESNFG